MDDLVIFRCQDGRHSIDMARFSTWSRDYPLNHVVDEASISSDEQAEVRHDNEIQPLLETIGLRVAQLEAQVHRLELEKEELKTERDALSTIHPHLLVKFTQVVASAISASDPKQLQKIMDSIQTAQTEEAVQQFNL